MCVPFYSISNGSDKKNRYNVEKKNHAEKSHQHYRATVDRRKTQNIQQHEKHQHDIHNTTSVVQDEETTRRENKERKIREPNWKMTNPPTQTQKLGQNISRGTRYEAVGTFSLSSTRRKTTNGSIERHDRSLKHPHMCLTTPRSA